MSLLKKKKRVKPTLTLRIFLFGLVDVVGMVLMSLGAVFFFYGPGKVFQTFPATTGEAVVTLAVGVGIMIYAAGNILREMMKQPHLGNEAED